MFKRNDYSYSEYPYQQQRGGQVITKPAESRGNKVWSHGQRLFLPECSDVFSISHGRVQSSRPRYIHIEALACSRPNLKADVRITLQGICHFRGAALATACHPPPPVSRCQGRSSHRRSGEARCRERWSRCRRLPGCRCHGEHPSNGMGEGWLMRNNTNTKLTTEHYRACSRCHRALINTPALPSQRSGSY